MKIYAVFMTYDQKEWLENALDQTDRALEFGSIDKVFIAEGGHSKNVPSRSPDGSWGYLQERLKGNDKYVLYDAEPFKKNTVKYEQVQAPLLNHMCNDAVKDVDDDVWIWYIHDDEFFLDSFLKNIRNIAIQAQEEDKDMVMTKQMAFAFNFKLYWEKRTAYMLFKWEAGTRWAPITTPCYAGGTPYLKRPTRIKFDSTFEHTTFHFSHVKRPKRLAYRAKDLPSEIGATAAAVWYREVYEKADLNNLEEVYNKNRNIQGGYGFYKDSANMGPPIMQILQTYNGEYPHALQTNIYKDIDDIRKV